MGRESTLQACCTRGAGRCRPLLSSSQISQQTCDATVTTRVLDLLRERRRGVVLVGTSTQLTLGYTVWPRSGPASVTNLVDETFRPLLIMNWHVCVVEVNGDGRREEGWAFGIKGVWGKGVMKEGRGLWGNPPSQLYNRSRSIFLVSSWWNNVQRAIRSLTNCASQPEGTCRYIHHHHHHRRRQRRLFGQYNVTSMQEYNDWYKRGS